VKVLSADSSDVASQLIPEIDLKFDSIPMGALVDLVRAEQTATKTGPSLPSGEAFRLSIMPSDAEIAKARRTLHRKALAVLATFLVSYISLVHPSTPAIVRALMFPLVAVSLIMAATSVMHDANHAAFFGKSKIGNKMVGSVADLLGVSSVLWRIEHDIHHADTNVQGLDKDIDQGAIARFAPAQEWKPWHKFQYLYLWPAYGLMGIQWLLVADFYDLFRGHVASEPIDRVSVGSKISVIAGKLSHVVWALAIPMIWHDWWKVVAVYFAGSWLMGFTLAVTFQMAHCVPTAIFTDQSVARRGDDFIWHQLNTTVDVAPCRGLVGRFRSLLIGGLDYQIEHHLAPHVPHPAYPAMAKRLQAACASVGVEYRTHQSAFGAIRAHASWLKTMSIKPAVASVR
jgi:linoleoyl-CoA desaturase